MLAFLVAVELGLRSVWSDLVSLLPRLSHCGVFFSNRLLTEPISSSDLDAKFKAFIADSIVN